MSYISLKLTLFRLEPVGIEKLSKLLAWSDSSKGYRACFACEKPMFNVWHVVPQAPQGVTPKDVTNK